MKEKKIREEKTKVKVFLFKDKSAGDIQTEINKWISQKEKDKKYNVYFEFIRQSESCNGKIHYVTITVWCNIEERKGEDNNEQVDASKLGRKK